MKKTAKWLATIAAVMMAFSFASCGSGDDDDTATVAETKNTLDAVGDIYLSDGTVIAAADANKMSGEQKAKAEAVVFYVGTSDSVLGNRTLAVNVKNSGTTLYVWAENAGHDTKFTEVQCGHTDTKPTSGTYYEYTESEYIYPRRTYYVTGDLDGSDNWEKIKATDPAGTADDVVAENYPAFNYVNTELGENYYLPTLAELEELCKNITTVNASIAAAGGTTLSGYYWSSSETDSSSSYYAWCVHLPTSLRDCGNKRDDYFVCGVRAFTH